MSTTIGRHRPRKSPRGDYETMCDICGIGYLRSQLRRRDDNLLVCKDDEGRSPTELDRGNAQCGNTAQARPVPAGGGNFDHLDDP